ncbi:Slp family lipoprotein [Vibrio parahaemolyticus]|uniref:Slp family lipoprotein n=1 Tax=Vibrio parahaemolyticus TaxID=670 RepID=UPI0009B71AAD|nr:Slp family lipoprotein [Vibrio parahaemolyticus]ELB2258744.1 Slp family lipoprotein [Vibrio parahaemolyticus]OQK32044.1 outer membrane lipoprotein Slp [Vibrio parahaemolyticus]
MKVFGRLFLVLVATFGLSACSSLPEELNASTEQVVTDYKAFAESQGELTNDVRLGGIIAKVDNFKDKTRLEIVNLPINKSGKPDIDQEPTGRFAVYFDGYLEPVAFSQGRLVTIVGKGAGEEEGKIGEHEYVFPLVKGQGYRLWKIEERVRMYDSPTYFYPCYSINCRMLRNDFPQDGKVIKQVK